jgi:triacylglycerol lipase
MARDNHASLRPAANPVRAIVFCCGLAAAAATALPAHATSEEAKTKYPIVLVHGLLGFDNVLGVDYFYRIPRTLTLAGGKVYIAKLSGTNTSEVRGEQLLKELRTMRALSKNPLQKYNLIGHSQGAPTARYVAAVAPDLVASVTSVSGTNGGSKVADMLASLRPGGFLQTVALKVVNNWNRTIGVLSGRNANDYPEAPLDALASLTTAGGAAFDSKFPQGRPPKGSGCQVTSGESKVDGVRYYSWAGASAGVNLFDLSDLPLQLLGTFAFFGEANDGLVATCTTRLGTHLGDYRQNHLDAINHVLGNTYASLYPYHEKTVPAIFTDHAARLKSAGL